MYVALFKVPGNKVSPSSIDVYKVVQVEGIVTRAYPPFIDMTECTRAVQDHDADFQLPLRAASARKGPSLKYRLSTETLVVQSARRANPL
jgi:hypothetical protein